MTGKIRIMYGHRESEPEYMEQIITEHEDRFESAERWALANGFIVRIATIDLNTEPDFAKAATA